MTIDNLGIIGQIVGLGNRTIEIIVGSYELAYN